MNSTAAPCLSKCSLVLDKFSLEITVRDAQQLVYLEADIPAGTIISVPFLVNETHADRIAAAKAVRAAGYEPMPHIAARRFHSEIELSEFICELSKQAQVKRLLVLAGDLDSPKGPYADTAAILRSGVLEKCGIEHVAVAGHPEGHPVQDHRMLLTALLEKSRILGERRLDWSIITQFTFASEPVLNWIASVRQEGIQVPIHVGVPGPASVKTLLRFAAVCGVSASTAVLMRYGLSISQLFTNAGPDRLVNDYVGALSPPEHGEIRLHFYPFGGVRKTSEWISQYRQRG
ncbi:methylenetetrahydrofolate reductase [Neorhizobium alkalisoli]|uniref:methylenetetrahydrofolate reductase n=1 Tax=Neorhizobium alkalisoli TaxID=528178 RepID=UPI000CFA01C8|nr:methylenetetrahydrofolate reductase [Neorhizobium alkalisoli]